MEQKILCSPATSSNIVASSSSSTMINTIGHSSDQDNSHYQEWILEAIDKLRERKARPDAERIAILLKRYHNITPEETQRCLDTLANLGVVVCVDYKGNVSYRNPSKWRRTNNGSGCILNTPSISQKILSAVSKLMNLSSESKDQSCQPQEGDDDQSNSQDILTYSASEIEEMIQQIAKESSCLEADSTGGESIVIDGNLTGVNLRNALDRECAYGGLARRSDGRYLLDVDREHRKAAAEEAQKWMQNQNNGIKIKPNKPIILHKLFKSSGVKRGRPPGSKKIKLNPTKQASQFNIEKPNFSEDSDSFVGQTAILHGCGKCLSNDFSGEESLQCQSCFMKVHPSCMGYWSDLTARIRYTNWQCEKCKMCVMCSLHKENEVVQVCDACNQGFHDACNSLDAASQQAESEIKLCNHCLNETAMALKDSEDGADEEPAPLTTTQTNAVLKLESVPSTSTAASQNETKPEPNDAKYWSVDDVFHWLTGEGYIKEARSFREQEIDGPSLLLMKRMDVLTQLGIKLGPAVKIYEKIKKLQSRSSWSYTDIY